MKAVVPLWNLSDVGFNPIKPRYAYVPIRSCASMGNHSTSATEFYHRAEDPIYSTLTATTPARNDYRIKY